VAGKKIIAVYKDINPIVPYNSVLSGIQKSSGVAIAKWYIEVAE
jgi:hypothetical protein